MVRRDSTKQREKRTQCDKRRQQTQEQGQKVIRELVDILCDPLIRIINSVLQLQLVIRAVRKLGAEISSSKPPSPAYLQQLLQIESTYRQRDAKTT
jgi:hypothetical protein